MALPSRRCLLIPEVIGLVCAEISNLYRPERNHALAVLARISHAWSEVALDFLWRYLHGVWPLLLCIPSDFWVLKNGQMVCIINIQYSIVMVLKQR